MGAERLRELVSGDLDPGLFERRREEGWRVLAIEWERNGETSRGAPDFFDVPFGFRVASDCRHLQKDAAEAEVLRMIMRGVVNDQPLSIIAGELNTKGFRTRSGQPWNPASVFRLLPAVVDHGPRILADPEWPAFRDR
jgi:hypothetical protein